MSNKEKPAVLAEQANASIVEQLVRQKPSQKADNSSRQTAQSNKNSNANKQGAQAAPKPNAPRPSAPRPSAPRPSAPRPSAPKQSVPRPSAPKQSAPRPSAPKQNAPRPSAPRQNTSKPNAPEPSANRQSQNRPNQQSQGGMEQKDNPSKKAPVKSSPVAARRATQKAPARTPSANRRKSISQPRGTLKIIPLGGMGEIGKNITYYEYNGEAIIIDCGIAFPDESMPGIDIVIPDFSYVVENQKKIKGLFVTHGHEDHIGSIPYLLKHFSIPVYATRLTIGLIEGKLKEHGLLRNSKLNVVSPGDIIKLNQLSVEFINVNHSIPGSCSIAVHTPVGVVIQTGDFKVDYTPIDSEVINLARFGELGSQGVLALLSDSTNADRPGSTNSERTVGGSLEKIFAGAVNQRIIVATFASNVHRVQQIMDSAVKANRKVAVSGRSMENVSAKAIELGYLKIPANTLIDVNAAQSMPPEKVVVITTGSQGEPMSALTRMARGDHRNISVTENDCIILSATPIPGNEKLVNKVVNDLLRQGADVFYDRMYEIHVSGHACQDELKLMMALTKPEYFLPVHGEYKHLKRHSELAVSMGIPKDKIFIGANGQSVEFGQGGMKVGSLVTAGDIMVDGLGVGDVGNIVLRDRMHLSEDGLLVVIATIKQGSGKILSGPDIVSRGFVYVRESEEMLNKAKDIAKKSIETSISNNNREWSTIKSKVRDDVGDYVWQTTKRRPMILPVIQEVR